MENKSLLMKSAMYYGLFLGIFWVIRYVFFVLGFQAPVMTNVYQLLTPIPLLIAYYSTKLYKAQLGGSISFFHAWQFGVMLYFFGAVIVSLAHFVFFQYLAPPGYLSDFMDTAVTLMKELNLYEQMKEGVELMGTPSPIQMTIQGIFNNVFYGVILSIPVAALLCRNNQTGSINNHPNQGESDT